MGAWSRGVSVLAGAVGWLAVTGLTTVVLRAAGPLGEVSFWLELLLDLAPLLLVIVFVRALLHFGAASSLWLGVAAAQLLVTCAVLGLFVVPLGAADLEVLVVSAAFPLGQLLVVTAVAFAASRRGLRAKLAGVGAKRRAEREQERSFDQL
jgi:hypothetical protein